MADDFIPRTDWVDDPSHDPAPEGLTPFTAADALRIENGISNAHTKADAAASAAQAADQKASQGTTWDSVANKPTEFSPASHQHPAGDITGTLSASNIPALSTGKVNGLNGELEELKRRLTALENASGQTPDPGED